ncbi:MAG: DEAD/DEAH box helicase, partial [Vulcanococcus sp.]
MNPEQDRRDARWLQVWLEAGREGQVFTYGNPEALELCCGDLVQVRLRGQRHIGLVVELLNAAPVELSSRQLQPIEALHQRAAVDPQWQVLIEAVAQQCRTSVFRTLKTALPPGWLGQRKSGKARGSRQKLWLELTDAGRNDSPASLSANQAQLLERLRQQNGCGWQQQLLEESNLGRSVADALLKRQLVSRDLRPCYSQTASGGLALQPPEQPRPLTPDQQAALNALQLASPGQRFLLWGVTGSGKTEVYLQAAAQQLEQGCSALVLTPEIGLIPQLLDRCRRRFGNRVVEYHSSCSDGQRIETWRRCLSSEEPLVVVGTRSAIFLPLNRLGLIVLDEEHDRSYKQDSPMPCYHARDVAALRAEACGARLLLGSATPSLETWLACQGKSPRCSLLKLPQRIGGRPLPPVHVVDMR